MTQGAEFGVIESVKAASDLFAPVSGTVAEVNSALEAAPETVNKDPYGKGGMIKLKGVDAAQANGLLTNAGYEATLE